MCLYSTMVLQHDGDIFACIQRPASMEDSGLGLALADVDAHQFSHCPLPGHLL